MSVKYHNPDATVEQLLAGLYATIPTQLADHIASYAAEDRRWAALAQLTHDWRLPANEVTVLTLAQAMRLHDLPPAESTRLADGADYQAARAKVLVKLADARQSAIGGRSRRARQTRWRQTIFCAAYEDPALALACLALHVTELRAGCDQLTRTQRRVLLEHSGTVFLYVAELFGLWRIRNELATQCLALFKPTAVHAIENALQSAQERRRQRFAQVESVLTERLTELGINGTLHEHESSIFSLYRRICSGGSLQRLATNVKVDIFVDTDDEYNRIGGQLVLTNDLSSTGRSRSAAWLWQEQLKFNGYHAMLLAMQRPVQEDEAIPSHIHICTRNMDRINTCGYVAARYWNVPLASSTRVWWTQLDPAPQLPGSTAVPPHMQVFGPAGERHTVPRGSTAIEFAYRVHADIGNHCKRIWLNGEPADAYAVLAPDDIVEIDFDIYCTNSTERWYKNSHRLAKPTTLKRAHSPRMIDANEGRQRLHEALERQFQLQRVPRPPEHDFDERLRTVVQAAGWNYVSIDALYTDLANRQLQRFGDALSAEEAANLIVTDILSRDIRYAANPTQLIPETTRIKLVRCNHRRHTCSVVRDLPIVGREHIDRRQGKTLKVFPRDCPDAPTGDRAVPLIWNSEQQLRVTIHAVDRAQLLGQILNALYQLSDTCYLYHLTAQTYLGPHATIEADIMVRNGSSDMLEPVLRQMRDSHLISTYEVSSVIGSQDPVAVFNPYGVTPAHTPKLFKGRHAEIDHIVDYARQQGGLIAVVGHNRIGKTSLLRYLANHVLPAKGIAAVFVSTGIAAPHKRGFWRAIALSINEQITSHDPADLHTHIRDVHKQHSVLRKSISRARRSLGQTKFVLVIDEFTKLQESWNVEDATAVLEHLQACMEDDPNLTIVVGLHEEVFQSRTTPLHQFLQHGITVRLDHLDEKSAGRLVVEPPGELVSYTHDAVQKLLYLTGCHPYYLQYLLTHLFTYLPSVDQYVITEVDVDRTVRAVLADGAVIFHQYRQHLRDTTALVVLSVAEILARQDFVSSTAIARVLTEYAISLPPRIINQVLQILVNSGILAVAPQTGYQYRVPLFQQWLRENRSLVETTDDYREGSPCRL